MPSSHPSGSLNATSFPMKPIAVNVSRHVHTDLSDTEEAVDAMTKGIPIVHIV